MTNLHRYFTFEIFIFSSLLRFRQYGLWERYADLYPDEDLVYTVGTSDYAKDWFFAQVTRFDSPYMFFLIRLTNEFLRGK